VALITMLLVILVVQLLISWTLSTKGILLLPSRLLVKRTLILQIKEEKLATTIRRNITSKGRRQSKDSYYSMRLSLWRS
jgi:hypothetical protein